MHNARMAASKNYWNSVIALGSALIVAGCGGGQSDPVAAAVTEISVPALPGSRSPNLARGPDGTVLLSWIELAADGHALKYSELSDGQWSASQEVAGGLDWFVNWADFPSVVPVSDKLFAAHWLVSQPEGGYAYDVFVSMSPDRGTTWTTPVRPHSDGTPTEHGFVSMYSHADGAGLVWLDGRNMANESVTDPVINGMTLRSAVISPDMTIANEQKIDGLICDCCQTDVALTARGPVAVYRDRTPDEIRDILVARATEGRWQEGRPIANDQWQISACPVNGPVIKALDNNLAVAWFTAADNVPMVRLAMSSDAGATFSAPVDVAISKIFGRVGAVWLPGGAVAVSWLAKTDAQQAEINIVRVDAGGKVGEPVVLARGQSISGFSVPQLTRVGERLLMAWTAEIDGEAGIQAAFIPISLLQPLSSFSD